MDALIDWLTAASPPMLAAVYAVASAVAAFGLCRWSLCACDLRPGWTPLIWSGVAAGLSYALTLAMLDGQCQETPDVRPSRLWWALRPAFHSLLIVLLAAATATDLRSYFILDAVTLGGAALAVGLATFAGDLQMCHVWVDWNAEVPQLRGPYIPEWLSAHPHAHGLAWSVAGFVFGAGVTWGARAAASRVLGQEALGFGDVTLMGLIGAFLGWQPVLLVFLLAPLCALAAGCVVRLCSAKTYIPYGPYLALAAVLVVFNWQALWIFELSLGGSAAPRGAVTTFAVRRLFGDATGLLILAAMLGGGLVLLLGAWRIYLSIPVPEGARQPAQRHESSPPTTPHTPSASR